MRRRKMSALQKKYFGRRKKKVNTPMARRIKRYSSRRKQGSFRGSMGGMTPYLAAGVYGAGRARLSNALAPFTSRIPFGGIADEVGLFATAWAAKKFLGNRVPFVSDVARAAMLIEAARMGEAIATGQVGFGTSTSSSQNGGVSLLA